MSPTIEASSGLSSIDLVLVVIAAAAVAWLLLLRPLPVGDVVLVLVVSLIVWWLVEVLQRRPEDVAAAAW